MNYNGYPVCYPVYPPYPQPMYPPQNYGYHQAPYPQPMYPSQNYEYHQTPYPQPMYPPQNYGYPQGAYQNQNYGYPQGTYQNNPTVPGNFNKPNPPPAPNAEQAALDERTAAIYKQTTTAFNNLGKTTRKQEIIELNKLLNSLYKNEEEVKLKENKKETEGLNKSLALLKIENKEESELKADEKETEELSKLLTQLKIENAEEIKLKKDEKETEELNKPLASLKTANKVSKSFLEVVQNKNTNEVEKKESVFQVLETSIKENKIETPAEENKEERVLPDKISFDPIPLRHSYENVRAYYSFEDHEITYGKDLTPVDFTYEEKIANSSMHAKMRLTLFKKLCQFVEKNRDNFGKYDISKNFVTNLYKAQASYTPEKLKYYDHACVEAHISFFPNLACSLNREDFFVHGGAIDLDGQIVLLEEMLNLTNRVHRTVNNIDAVSEAYLRKLGTDLLWQIRNQEITVDEATDLFAQKYLDCMNALLHKVDPTLAKNIETQEAKKISDTQNLIQVKENYSYNGYSYYAKVNWFYKPFIKGFKEGISSWKNSQNT